jgi:hypothetical protein
MISESGENLVFICCLPRSGSTLLSAVLGNHPDVCSPPEPWVLLRLAEVYGEPAEGKIYDDHVASKAVRDFLDHDNFVASARSFAVTAYNRRLAKGGHRILVDKTPRYYHILDFVRELFPQAKVIWLKRNPLDVAASYKVSWRKGLDYLTGKTLDPISFDFSVGLPNLFDFFAKSTTNNLEIKYEELVGSPEAEVRRLAAFCGLQFDPTMLELNGDSRGLTALGSSDLGDRKIYSSGGVNVSSVGAWRQDLDQAEITQVAGMLGRDAFTRMGYEEVAEEIAGHFGGDPGADVLDKARKKQLDKFQTMHVAQMSLIYELEARVRRLEKELEEKDRASTALCSAVADYRQRLQEAVTDQAARLELISSLEEKLRRLEHEKEQLEELAPRHPGQTRASPPGRKG